MDKHDDRNGMLYVLAGIGLGALIGAACGMLFAPKVGTEMRADIGEKWEDLRKKVQDLTGEATQKIGETIDKAKVAIQAKAEADAKSDSVS